LFFHSDSKCASTTPPLRNVCRVASSIPYPTTQGVTALSPGSTPLELVADAVAAESAADDAALDAGADTLLVVFTVDASAVASALEFVPPLISSGNEKAKAFLTSLLDTFLVRCFRFCSGGDAAATRLPELAPVNDDDASFKDSATAEARLGTGQSATSEPSAKLESRGAHESKATQLRKALRINIRACAHNNPLISPGFAERSL